MAQVKDDLKGLRKETNALKMKKPKVKKLKTLPLEELAIGFYGSTSGLRKRVNRQSRAVNKRSRRYNVKHIPTGIEVYGEIPEGHYTKKQMKTEERKLLKKLLLILEEKVSKHKPEQT